MFLYTDCDGKIRVTSLNGETQELSITLEQIVAFATGIPQEPPMGFIPRPSIHFQNQFKLPSANTCGSQINLPY